MANYTIDEIRIGENTYKIKDTISNYITDADISQFTGIPGAGSGLTLDTSENIFNHSNSVTAKTTQALYPITFDTEGHITSSGTAITALSNFDNDIGYLTSADVPEGASAYTGTISAIDITSSSGNNNGFARGDHIHNITGATIISALGYTPYNSTNPNGYITGITSSNITTALGYTPGTSNLTLGNTSSTAAAGNHTHNTTITTTNNTENITLAYDTKYQLTAGGTNYVFKMPAASGGGSTSSETDPIFTASDAATIFIAIYGTTTYSEVQTAYNAGKTLFAIKNNAVYNFKNKDSLNNIYNFYQLSGLSQSNRVSVDSSTGWTSGTFTLVIADRKINNKNLYSDITLTASDVGALSSSTSYVSSFNGSSGAITYTAPVTSVNNQTGAVTVSVPSAGSSATAVGSAAAAGSATTWSRSDHTHNLSITLNNNTYTPTNGVIDLGTISGGSGSGTIVSIVRW